MVLFYLQNTDPPVLPSIGRLQELARDQDGWPRPVAKLHGYDFDFCDDVDRIGRSQNTQSTAALLAGFFR